MESIRCRFESKCECFPVANILSLKTCNSTSSLCCPEFCALPLSLLLSIFIHVISFVSGFMLPALCLKLKEEAPFIRLSTLSNYYWTQVRKLWSLNIGYQSTRLSLQWCCCANDRLLSHTREWQKLNACFGPSARSRWALLSWWSLIRPLQMKYPPPLLHHPLRSSRRVSGLAWWVSWRRQVLAVHLKWSLPSISVSLTLKDANPAETLNQARSTLYSQQRSSWMAARASLSMRPSMVEALWKPEIELRAICSTTEFLSEYGRRRSKCDTIMLRIWQPFSCYSTLSTASELRLWALAQKIQQYTHLDLVCSLRLSRVSHPFDILVVLKHLEEPHDQPRCSDHQHLKIHICRFMCPHLRRHVRWIRRPRECALCAVFIPPHSLLAFPLAALQSCWNPKHNRRRFVALIATVYCTWLVPISLMMET